MSAVIGTQTDPSWLASLWEEKRSWLISAALLLISLIIWKISGGETVFPASWIEALPFADKFNEFDQWLRPYVQPTTRAIAAGVVWLYEGISDFLIFTQWQVVFVILVLPAFAYGGLRLGLLAILAVLKTRHAFLVAKHAQMAPFTLPKEATVMVFSLLLPLSTAPYAPRWVNATADQPCLEQSVEVSWRTRVQDSLHSMESETCLVLVLQSLCLMALALLLPQLSLILTAAS